MSDRDQLQVPDAATQDSRSFELLRVWVANKQQHISLRTGVWKDPAAWGVMLSDLMHHIANAYKQTEGMDPRKTLERIRAGLDAEMSSPSGSPSGAVK